MAEAGRALVSRGVAHDDRRRVVLTWLLAAPLALVLVRDADLRRPLAEFALLARRASGGVSRRAQAKKGEKRVLWPKGGGEGPHTGRPQAQAL